MFNGRRGANEVHHAPARPSTEVCEEAAPFDEFVAPHLSILRAVALREVGRSDAEDLVQDTLLRAWRRWSSFDRARGSARAWLCAILLDQVRGRRRRWKPAREPDLALAIAEPTEQRIDMERAIRKLPPRQRQVIVLYYLVDLPVDEIASVIGVSPGTVKSTLSDARARLRFALRGLGHDEHR